MLSRIGDVAALQSIARPQHQHFNITGTMVSQAERNLALQVDRSLLRALEACSEEAIGGEDWAARLDEDFLANLGRYRKYNPGSLRDLLRVIRNKHNHFREMPEQLQERLGPLPEAFLK